MSRQDPDSHRSRPKDASRPIDSTQAFVPAEAQHAPPLPNDLPKIPGITLHFELARGGMGVVYSGRQDFLDRRVAVKLLSVELGGDSFVQRFQREAKILAGIKHPNIVSCHMAGTTDDGQSYLVMEFIDGPSLKKWVGDHGPVSVPASLRLMRATAQALAHAHTLGIIHRDVKPENILLETVTSTALDVAFPFIPKVVDLGLARASEGSASLGLTSPGSVMGTPATMSPEQYDEPDAVDFRSDIYGLGCVFYEMLVGQPAFRGRKLSEIVTQKREPIAPNPCVENPQVPTAVGALVQCMLACNRDDRPRSYKDLDERLVELIDTLASSRTRAPAKTTPPPVVGEETEWGAGPLQRPSQAKVTKTPPRGTVPPPPVKPGAPTPTGPGLLRTAEINFLAEGLEAPANQAAPAFQDPGATVVSMPKEAPVGGTPTGAVPVSQPLPPSPRRPVGKVVALAALAVVGAGGAYAALSGGGDDPGTNVTPPQPGDSGKPKPPPKAKNQPPVVEAIVGAEAPQKLRTNFVIEAKVGDPDKDSLAYSWNLPEEMRIVGSRDERNKPKATVRVEDGLPGVEYDVELEVSDGKTPPVKHLSKVIVGDVPFDDALAGYKTSPSWTIDDNDFSWVAVADGYASCNANSRSRWMTTNVGSDTYWEWTGYLKSSDSEVSGPALVGLRFEFGDQGWIVVCTRTERGDDAGWSIELMKATRAGEAWTAASLEPRTFHTWSQPDVDEACGWFRVQRRGAELRIELGDALIPASTLKEQSTSRLSRTLPIDASAPEPKVTLFVDKGIGRFRVSKR